MTPAGSAANSREPAGAAPAADSREPAGEAPAVEASEPAGQDYVRQLLGFVWRRLTGDYPVDDLGFDPDFTASALLPLARQLYHHWFRVQVVGPENLPRDRGGLIVANHAGGLWALDAIMTATAVHAETGGERFLRMLGADLVFDTPGLGPLARKIGATLACQPDAERLLQADELVGVWPEGYKGIGKPFSERYQLQRFGRGGFVSAALRTGKPIIATAIVGSEEIYPVLGYSETMARLLRLPYFPLTPTFPWLGPLGLIPLPSKWFIEFCAPLETAPYGPDAADDPALVAQLADQVREQVGQSLQRLLARRTSAWE